MEKIHILTGPVHTGKTTRLMQWAASQINIDGIFQPIIDDKRFIYQIALRTLRMLELPTATPEDKIIKIGNYLFSKKVFEWSQKILVECIERKLEWLIIDEIGPLELGGIGLEPAITKVFEEREKFSGKILCVVRDTLLERFIEHYNLEDSYTLSGLPDIQ